MSFQDLHTHDDRDRVLASQNFNISGTTSAIKGGGRLSVAVDCIGLLDGNAKRILCWFHEEGIAR